MNHHKTKDSICTHNKTFNVIFVSAGHFVALTLIPQNNHRSQKHLKAALNLTAKYF